MATVPGPNPRRPLPMPGAPGEAIPREREEEPTPVRRDVPRPYEPGRIRRQPYA